MSPNDDMAAMSGDHDPLCPNFRYENLHHCHCSTIAKARSDERENAAQRVEQGVLGPEGIIFGCPVCGDPWESEPSCEHWAGIQRLADVVRGES